MFRFYFLLLCTFYCIDAIAFFKPDKYTEQEIITDDRLIQELNNKFQEKSAKILSALQSGAGDSRKNPIKITKTRKEAVQEFITEYSNSINRIRKKIEKYRANATTEALGNFIASILPPKAYKTLDLIVNDKDLMFNVFVTYYAHVFDSIDDIEESDTPPAYDNDLIERNMKRYYGSLDLFFAVKACTTEGYLKPNTWVRYEEYIGSLRDSVSKKVNYVLGEAAISTKAATRLVTRQCKNIKPLFCKNQCQPKLCQRGAIHGAACKNICQGDLEKHVKKCVTAYDETYVGKKFPRVVITGIPPEEALKITNEADIKRTGSAVVSDPKYSLVHAFLDMINVKPVGKYYEAKKLPS